MSEDGRELGFAAADDAPIPYLQRIRSYYQALGYGAPHFPLAHHYAREGEVWMYGRGSHDRLTDSGDWREQLVLTDHRYMREDLRLGETLPRRMPRFDIAGRLDFRGIGEAAARPGNLAEIAAAGETAQDGEGPHVIVGEKAEHVCSLVSLSYK